MKRSWILLAALLILTGCARQSAEVSDFKNNNSFNPQTYVNDTKSVEIVLCEDLNNNSVCDSAEGELAALEEKFLDTQKTKEFSGNILSDIERKENANDRAVENATKIEKSEPKIEEEAPRIRKSSEYLNISSLDKNLTMWRIPKFTKILKFYPNASITFGNFSIFYERDETSKKVLILSGVVILDIYSIPIEDKKVRVYVGDKDQFYVKSVESWFIFQVKSLGAAQFSLGLIRVDEPDVEFVDSGIPPMFDY